MSYVEKAAAIARLGVTPLSPFQVIWANRKLIGKLTSRELQSRYKGSVFGLAWALITPLLALIVFSFVFTQVLPSRWPGAPGARDYSLLLFVGLTIYMIFTEVMTRAPGLLLENVSYIKKVVFPVEVLAITSVLTACINAVFSFVIFILFHLYFRGLPPWEIIFLPVVIAPYALVILGAAWFLSALGIYVRDLRYVVVPATNLLLFLSPVFFPSTALPADFQPYLYLNPITFIIEQARHVALDAMLPNVTGLLIYYAVAILIAWSGLAWFTATRRGFADVV